MAGGTASISGGSLSETERSLIEHALADGSAEERRLWLAHLLRCYDSLRGGSRVTPLFDKTVADVLLTPAARAELELNPHLYSPALADLAELRFTRREGEEAVEVTIRRVPGTPDHAAARPPAGEGERTGESSGASACDGVAAFPERSGEDADGEPDRAAVLEQRDGAA